MKRIGILTAGGDTPALNATLYGAVMRACQLRIEAVGFIKGFSSLLHDHVPQVHLNPLFLPIPKLDPTRGGTILIAPVKPRTAGPLIDRFRQAAYAAMSRGSGASLRRISP